MDGNDTPHITDDDFHPSDEGASPVMTSCSPRTISLPALPRTRTHSTKNRLASGAFQHAKMSWKSISTEL